MAQTDGDDRDMKCALPEPARHRSRKMKGTAWADLISGDSSGTPEVYIASANDMPSRHISMDNWVKLSPREGALITDNITQLFSSRELDLHLEGWLVGFAPQDGFVGGQLEPALLDEPGQLHQGFDIKMKSNRNQPSVRESTADTGDLPEGGVWWKASILITNSISIIISTSRESGFVETAIKALWASVIGQHWDELELNGGPVTSRLVERAFFKDCDCLNFVQVNLRSVAAARNGIVVLLPSHPRGIFAAFPGAEWAPLSRAGETEALQRLGASTFGMALVDRVTDRTAFHGQKVDWIPVQSQRCVDGCAIGPPASVTLTADDGRMGPKLWAVMGVIPSVEDA
ncbi:hypothetical protein PVAR5_7438 [Paecilomyces variotii No. 5]|uniref:Uncharacterized protein n=1 Tax=Byssochlamys spectabilis (strain No. 5 / NBRC 109023) TaxID=1356009 RepID=V5GCT6_BYSSN|nr:hypothetical protein PVAR5_7438 [Paecilomyces variotii No. 5]